MKLLIGGQALRNLGSSRHTNDVDFLINSKFLPTFSNDAAKNIDYINGGGGNDFFAAICKMEKNNITDTASVQALLELKAYAWIQHYQNGKFQKADDCVYDMRFLVRKFELKNVPVCKKHVSAYEFSEIMKIISSVK
jgi:hypothetical protein